VRHDSFTAPLAQLVHPVFLFLGKQSTLTTSHHGNSEDIWRLLDVPASAQKVR
jgi:hypothetical protein